jgi:cell division protein FtsQ
MKPLVRTKPRKTPGRTWIKKGYLVLVLVVLLVSAGVAFSLVLVRASVRMFPVREILFSGNMHITEAELNTLAGVRPGEGLLTVSGRDVSSRLLQSPWIRTVSIRKDLPDRLMIRVSEATPFAILDRKGQAFLIDEKGRLLEKIHGDSVPFLPIISADPERMHESFIEAIRLAAVIKERKIATERNRVEIIANVKAPEELSLVVDSVVIKIGRGDYEQKLERLFALEDEIRKRMVTVDYVDLRFANRVVVKAISEVVR